MKIAVSCESTNDLGKELNEKYNISIIPFHITLGEQEFIDGEKTTNEIFEYVDKNKVLPKTCALNAFQYTEYFESLRKEYDAVVHICLSSGITSTINNARIASQNVENVYIVDSLSLSTGIGLLCMYARELAEQGTEPSEIARLTQERASKLQTSFVIERLDYLYKGGRCNSLQLLGANLLKIRPRIIIKDGKMINDKKYRGRMEKVVANYCEEALVDFNTPDLEKVFITYTTATEEMKNCAREIVKKAGFKNIYETVAGGTIACHCGANTIGILYFNDGKKN